MTSQEKEEVKKMIRTEVSKTSINTRASIRAEILKVLPEALGRSLVQIRQFFLQNIT